MNCLLVSSDLMWSSQVAVTLRAAGYEVKSRSSLGELQEASLDHVNLVVIDLNTNSADVASLPAAMQSDPSDSIPVLAIGPHVHTEKLAAARQAGWEVVTRGQFHAQHADILQKLASEAENRRA